METLAPVVTQKKYNRLGAWLVNAWTQVITIGVNAELTHWDRKRIRLLNGICAMSVIIYTLLILQYSAAPYRLTLLECTQALAAYLFVIFLNSRKKYETACHFYCVYNILCYTFLTVSHGNVNASDYILIASSISALLFFRKLRTILLYFSLNVLFFFFCQWSFTHMKPFLFMANGKNFYVSNHITLFVVSFLIVYYFKVENTRQERLLAERATKLAAEKQISESLLLNVLPAEIAEELKATGTAKAKSFEMVTVMLGDFKNFTTLAEKLSPEKLVAEINHCFSAFDEIVSRHGVEKIKTIGDAYLCAGGLPQPNDTNPVDVVKAALEIQQFMQAHKEERLRSGEPYFELRIGVHTGPVVAGIVGIKKYSYDIWSETVTIASRHENLGQIGRVNVSETTYERIKEMFVCTLNETANVNSSDSAKMYFVERAFQASSV